MGSLQQQSVLKGKNTARNNNGDLVHELFRKSTAAHSDKTAIIYEDEGGEEHGISYGELDSTTNKIARTLRSIVKLRENTDPIVAVSMKPSVRLPVTLLSILKSGMAYLPLDAEFPSSRVKHILQEAEPLLVIVEENDARMMYEDTPVITFEQLWEKSEDKQDDPLMLDEHPEQIAIVLYTSGSTGIPKGVRLPHATLINRLEWQWRELPYGNDEERCIFKTALTFVDSAPEIWGPLLQARTIVIVPREVTKDPARFVKVLEKHQIRRLVLVPSLLRSMLMYLSLRNKDGALESLKLWICSGETLPHSLAKQFFARFSSGQHILANFYGSTEVMGDVTYHLSRKASELEDLEKVPIGRPLDNCIIYLVNKEMRLVAQGEVGELVVAGRNLAAGYIRGRDPYKFIDNPHAIDPEYSTIYRTGDYARIVKGIVVYEGRTDAQIKIRGHRVDLAEVERSVTAAPGVDKAVVLCYKPGELSQALIAFVTAKRATSVSGLQTEDYLQSRLPPYMVPQVIVIDSIPLLVNGKIDRQTLLGQYESSNLNEKEVTVDCEYNDVPEHHLEKAKILFPTVAAVIGKSGRSKVNVDSNFYELGGDSLNSIYTVTKLRDQGYQISITDFIAAKNMAAILDKMVLSNDSNEFDESMDESEYAIEQLNNSHKKEVIEIITDSFYMKADLERWLLPNLDRNDYTKLMETLWDALVEKGFCFVVKASKGDERILAASLNFDARDEPEVTIDSNLTIIFEFLESLEGPIRDGKLPQGRGQIFHTFMMGTNKQLSSAQNVIMMKLMEDESLRLAKRKGFVGIFTTNTSPLTQQLGSDIYNYEVLLDYQVNKYVAPDGTKPFGKASDDQRALCSWKSIRDH